ncbi:MAG TPA: response regulator, partial [Labilithrix sp.]|nr:response regulator [Labilithrix sp.]
IRRAKAGFRVRRPAVHGEPPAAPHAPPGVGRGTQPSLGGSIPSRTLVFGENAAPAAPGVAAQPARAAAPVATPTSQPTAPPAAPAVAAAVNGHLSGKLGELGLSPQQADAVLALSREVVERVVWEVVPQLAEAIIKEEIARLTRD